MAPFPPSSTATLPPLFTASASTVFASSPIYHIYYHSRSVPYHITLTQQASYILSCPLKHKLPSPRLLLLLLLPPLPPLRLLLLRPKTLHRPTNSTMSAKHLEASSSMHASLSHAFNSSSTSFLPRGTLITLIIPMTFLRRGLFSAIGKAGEQVRGNINAALVSEAVALFWLCEIVHHLNFIDLSRHSNFT